MKWLKATGLFGFIALLGLSVLLSFGCSKKNSPTTPAAATPTPVPGSTIVTTSGLTFSPATVTIKAGKTVEWTNLQAGGHNVVQMDDLSNCSSITSGGFSSGAAGAVATFSHTFPTVGTYYYECTVHCGGGMTGTVVVN